VFNTSEDDVSTVRVELRIELMGGNIYVCAGLCVLYLCFTCFFVVLPQADELGRFMGRDEKWEGWFVLVIGLVGG
jgi:hypothetical protein